jgi:hypothetical protein
MGLQVNTPLADSNPILLDQDAGSVTRWRWAATSNLRNNFARAFAFAGACVLWLLVASTLDKAPCANNIGAEVLVVPPESPQDTQDTVGPHVTREQVSVDTPPAATSVVKQQQIEGLDLKPDSTDELARELASFAAELEKARIAGLEAARVLESTVNQRRALQQEHARADALARQVASLRVELDARNAAPDAVQVAAAEQKQALERELNQERDKTSALARELSSLREELAATRVAGQEGARSAEAATNEQQLASTKERARNQVLASELASARKEAEERSARLAAAHAEALQVTDINDAKFAEQNQALAGERDRADALARELSSARNEIEFGKKLIARLQPLHVPQSRGPTDERAPTRGDRSATKKEAEGRSAGRPSSGAIAPSSERPFEAKAEARPSTAPREAAADLNPKSATVDERSAPTSAAARLREDEVRLLARASALLRLADISGARPLLEHALEHGSARAAFMLAETYDTRVLQSWRARGISGDPAMARKLYEQAQAGGIEDAKERIETLK